MKQNYFARKGTSEYWNNLYDSYKRQRKTLQSKNYMLEEQYSFETFKDFYSLLEEKGITQNTVRALVNDQKLISYSSAKEILRRVNPNAKLTFKNISEYLQPERVKELMNKPWVMFGKEQSNRGMSIEQAYFAYMSEIGMKDEAEAEYGY